MNFPSKIVSHYVSSVCEKRERSKLRNPNPTHLVMGGVKLHILLFFYRYRLFLLTVILIFFSNYVQFCWQSSDEVEITISLVFFKYLRLSRITNLLIINIYKVEVLASMKTIALGMYK